MLELAYYIMVQAQSVTELQRTEGRGKFLTTMIVLLCWGLLGFIQIIIRYLASPNPHLIQDYYAVSPTIYISGHIFFLIMNLVVLIGILWWKKAAVYTLFLFKVAWLLVAIFLFHPVRTYLPFVSLGTFTVDTSLWIWAIKRKWHLFT